MFNTALKKSVVWFLSCRELKLFAKGNFTVMLACVNNKTKADELYGKEISVRKSYFSSSQFILDLRKNYGRTCLFWQNGHCLEDTIFISDEEFICFLVNQSLVYFETNTLL